MADYHEHFSDQLIVKLTDEEREWVEKILRPVDCHDYPSEDPELQECWDFLMEHIDREIIEDDVWPRFNCEIDDEGVWMYDDGGCFQATHVVEFVHLFIKKFRPKMVWKMTWAGSCTRPQLGQFGGGWAVVDVHGAAFGNVWRAAERKVTHVQDPWSDDKVQFARLICEISATGINYDTLRHLMKSMDLEPKHIDELLARAKKVWETCKDLSVTTVGGRAVLTHRGESGA
jgi:hypothetical protein